MAAQSSKARYATLTLLHARSADQTDGARGSMTMPHRLEVVAAMSRMSQTVATMKLAQGGVVEAAGQRRLKASLVRLKPGCITCVEDKVHAKVVDADVEKVLCESTALQVSIVHLHPYHFPCSCHETVTDCEYKKSNTTIKKSL